MLTPPFIAPRSFDDPVAALAEARRVYDGAIAHLRAAIERFIAGEDLLQRVRACYPFVRVHTDTVARADSRLSYGFVAGPGTYETTLTRPDLFGGYYLRAVPPAAAEPPRVARGRHEHAADPGALLVRRPRTTSKRRCSRSGAC